MSALRWRFRELHSMAPGDRVLLRPHPKAPRLYVGTVAEGGEWPTVEKGKSRWGLVGPDEVLCVVPFWEMPQEAWRSSA